MVLVYTALQCRSHLKSGNIVLSTKLMVTTGTQDCCDNAISLHVALVE